MKQTLCESRSWSSEQIDDDRQKATVRFALSSSVKGADV